ncbi:MAG: hypothetical protein DRJ01_04970 [Bacteroidetes bacterium]|nr:MAG: hypothetical protein DRJ01_04970 [Bacteroidota bacterium]
MIKPTRKMIWHFFERTKNHIELVEKWYNLIMKQYSEIPRIPIENHDLSKFAEPEYTPYIFTTWSYYCKRKGIDYEIPEDIKEMASEATIYHILSNPHHPEHWESNFSKTMFNAESRDDVPVKIVDATKMPNEHITELMADWFAVAEERKTNPYDWAELNINKRWKFTNRQVELIYDILDNVWEKHDN